MRNLIKFLKPYKLQLIIGPLCKLLDAVFELALPLIMANIIDVGIKNGDKAYVLNGGLIMLGLGVLGWLFSLVCQKSAAVASQGSGTKLRSALFAHVNTLSFQDLDKIGTSSLITRLTNDINQLQLAVAMLIRLVIRAPFLVIGAFILSMTINLKISLIFFGASLLIAVVLYIIMSKSVPFFRAIQRRLDKLSLLSRESLSGARVIRAFAKQKFHTERFSDENTELAKTAVRVGRLSAWLNPLTFVIANLGVVLIVWFGGKFVFAGTMQTGEIVALINYMNQILLSMIILANLVVIFTKASACAARINQVLSQHPSVKEISAQEADPLENSAKITFENVYFSYCSEKYALQNISFSIACGETVGIIGTTGSGKTSLIGLIPRFYNIEKGRVLVDGIDVEKYPFEQLRGKISMVPQQTVLLSGTVKENLTLGNKNATNEEIEQALSLAQAKEFVDKLPHGINSHLTRGGRNLSGGQRQRLAIARALVSTGEILILDDSTSALDFATDAAVRRGLKQNTSKTVIIVSQRVSSVREADKIIVLKQGKTAGIGTHGELFANCSEYKEICLSQEQSPAKEVASL